MWECMTDDKCEGFPGGIPNHESDKSSGTLFKLVDPGRNDQWGVFPNSLFLTWTVLVEEYSKRSLTKPTHKLVAFAGIAKLFQENTGDEYVAGLWRSRFVETLNWRVTTPGPAAVDYLAPSWSWASVQSSIEIEGRSTLGKRIKLVSVMAIETIKLESDATLGVCYGRIKLYGALFPAQWDNPPDSIRIRSAPHIAEVHLDTSSGNWDGKEDLFLLPIILDPYGRALERRFVYYLILKRHSTWTNFYQRIGHCQTNQEVKGLGQTFTAKDIVEGIFEEGDFDEPIFGVTAQFSEISIV
ncbi:HET domain-containing protein [Fusarium sp. LHS14.1]|nr:HET domain-containing protein [Fusarium sp. LHS14.1]